MTTVSRRGEAQYYDDFYAHEAQRVLSGRFMRLSRSRAARQVLKWVGPFAGTRVLSLGSGDSFIESAVATEAEELIAIDLSAKAIAVARTKAPPKFHFLVGDATNQPFRPASFDIILAFGFLHHVPAVIPTIMSQAYQTLRPGGVFLSMDPSARRLAQLGRWLTPGAWRKYHSPEEHELDPDFVAGCASTAGFDDVRIRLYDFIANPIAWVVPGLPNPLGRAILALDEVALRVPLLRRLASGFGVIARRP